MLRKGDSVPADWSRLEDYLAASEDARIVLSFVEIESILGGELPPSARRHRSMWSNSSAYAVAWRNAGFASTSRGVPAGHMGFERTTGATARRASPRVTSPEPVARPSEDDEPVPKIPLPSGTDTAAGRIVLIGCARRKLNRPARARDLYVSAGFLKRMAYAEATACPWFVISAERGLLAPDSLVEPYDTHLEEQTRDYRRAWGEWVVAQLSGLHQLQGVTVEVHAGASYVEPLREPLAREGALLSAPLAGLRQGERLAWYDRVVTEPPSPVGQQTQRVAGGQRAWTPHSQNAVVRALLDFGANHTVAVAGTASFTPHPAANQLVIDDAFAFLLGVIFDQGIPAERAWRAPFDLMQRLGHLDPQRMVDEPDRVRGAIAQSPVLHRYREKMPDWLVSAARIIVRDYSGDASRLWSDAPTAAELQRRFDRFPGIGQKKAAMAVEILERDLGVAIRDMQGSDIAYDVHVRRVLLRTGLAEVDDLEHMLTVTRRLHPERPGAIDLPAWLIGRQWCRAGIPNCAMCPLVLVCPQEIERGNTVRGA